MKHRIALLVFVALLMAMAFSPSRAPYRSCRSFGCSPLASESSADRPTFLENPSIRYIEDLYALAAAEE